MQDVELYNLDPVLLLAATGLGLAGLLLAWLWWRHRHASGPQRMRALSLLTLFITFDLVVFGAFTRLTDSGLGCPDWPGCYGSASPIGARSDISAAQAAMPTGPVTHSKAWIEMIHRYLATTVGVLIIAMCLGAWWVWRRTPAAARARLLAPRWALLALVWVCVQGAFGALTVTMKLFPFIVTLHLMFGIGLLGLLSLLWALQDPEPPAKVSVRLRRWMLLVFAVLWVQIALGGWVSTNYAVLACPDFPTCHGQWVPPIDTTGFTLWRELGHDGAGQLLPFSALVTIHFVHRSMAWLVLALMAALAWAAWRVPGQQGRARALALLALLQLGSGLSNVILGWPLLAALMHPGGAAALVVLLTIWLARTRALPVSQDFSAPSATTPRSAA